jgi:hypothetical protein
MKSILLNLGNFKRQWLIIKSAIAGLIVIVFMSVLLAGCDGNNNNKTDANKNTESESESKNRTNDGQRRNEHDSSGHERDSLRK